MVIVELFSKYPVENVTSAVAADPERIIFVGDGKRMKNSEIPIRRFLADIGKEHIELEFRSVRTHDLSDTLNTLTSVVEKYPDCHIDLTGGSELAIAAAGIIFERYKTVEIHQYNIRTGMIYDCDRDGTVISSELPAINTEQNVILHGGRIVYEDEKGTGTGLWDVTDEFKEDVKKMWDVCREDCTLWNRQVNALGGLLQLNVSEDPSGLTLDVPLASVRDPEVKSAIEVKKMFYRLEKAGLIRDFVHDDRRFGFRFKNDQIKRALKKAGNALELITYIAAMDAEYKDGRPFYNDAMTGVLIDWDSVLHGHIGDTEVDTENEIDVILMHGVVPVFISCKNGAVGEDELYKVHAVAEQFGSWYAKKVLIATTFGKKGSSMKHFLTRAADMGIQVVSGVHELSYSDFVKRLKTLV